MYITDKKILYVDSSLRLIGSNADFQYSFDSLDPNSEYDKVVVLNASIPKSNYVINSSNNSFVLEENSVQRTITIPVGNYSRKSFKVVLQTQLNTNPETGYSSYIVSYDNTSTQGDTGKYTFSVTNPSNPQPVFIFTTGLTDVMGFDDNTSYTFSANTLVSVNVISFRLRSSFYLYSDISQNKGDSILQNIVVTADDFEQVYFVNPIPYEYAKSFVKNKSNIYSFRLLDGINGNVLDLNGVPFTFTIMLYKENKVSALLTSYIKFKSLLTPVAP